MVLYFVFVDSLPRLIPGFNNAPFKFIKNSNAYMLVYIRESDKEIIICDVDEEEIAQLLRIKLKKEQEEEFKRKYEAEAHLYTIVKVARDDDLLRQIGNDIHFDLVDHEKVRHFHIQKQIPFMKFKEWVTDSPFVISPGVTFEVSVRLLGGLMALGYTIAAILKRISNVFFDERVSVKIDWLEQLNRQSVQEEVAREFDVPVQLQRYWIWVKRQNHTYRPNKCLTPREEAQIFLVIYYVILDEILCIGMTFG